MKRASRLLIALFVFVVTHLVFAWIAWAGGMDFDQRGSDLKLWAVSSLLFGGYFAALVLFFPFKERP